MPQSLEGGQEALLEGDGERTQQGRRYCSVDNRPAREIEPEEVTEVLRPIFERGVRSMADHVRSYIRGRL